MAFKELIPPKINAREYIKLTAMKRGGHTLIFSPDLVVKHKFKGGMKCAVLLDLERHPACIRVQFGGKGQFVLGTLRGAATLRLGVLPSLRTVDLKGLLCEWDEDAADNGLLQVDIDIPPVAMRETAGTVPAANAPRAANGGSLIHRIEKDMRSTR